MALGLAVAGVCVLLTCLSFSDLSIVRQFHVEVLQIRWWFVAAAVLYLTVALIVSQGAEAIGHPTLLVAFWLAATFPFGLNDLPRDPAFPVIGSSAWAELAPHVVGATAPRGCIPLNPYPWYVGFNCHTLSEPPASASLVRPSRPGGSRRFAAPAGAAAWSVDTISFILANDRPSLGLVALDAAGRELSRASRVPRRASRWTFFHFDVPLYGVSSVELIGEDLDDLALIYRDDTDAEPVWLWYGRDTVNDARASLEPAAQ
jgi:hypothetical protein